MSDIDIRLEIPVLIKPEIEELKTSATDIALVYGPDGTGKVIARAESSGGGGISLNRILVIAPGDDIIIGQQYPTFVAAQDYAVANLSPSVSARVGILVPGINNENFGIKTGIVPLGYETTTRFTGDVSIDASVPAFPTGVYDVFAVGCIFDNFDVAGKTIIMERCRVRGSNNPSGGIIVMNRGSVTGGDLSGLNSLEMNGANVTLELGSSNNIVLPSEFAFNNSFLTSQGGGGAINLQGGKFKHSLVSAVTMVDGTYAFDFCRIESNIPSIDAGTWELDFCNYIANAIPMDGGILAVSNSKIKNGVSVTSGTLYVDGKSTGLGVSYGTTTQRPTNGQFIGAQYYDTTIVGMVTWSGSAWV